jgi:hypothetical protein
MGGKRGLTRSSPAPRTEQLGLCIRQPIGRLVTWTPGDRGKVHPCLSMARICPSVTGSPSPGLSSVQDPWKIYADQQCVGEMIIYAHEPQHAAQIHRSVTTYSVQNSISDTLSGCPLFPPFSPRMPTPPSARTLLARMRHRAIQLAHS